MIHIRRVAVVIPARDEEELIADCLLSVEAAVRHVRRVRGLRRADVTVVADACMDWTVRLARTFPGVRVVEISAGNVGEARRTGVALALAGERRPASTWIANTDADTTVPADWLSKQLELADGGDDAVVGTVRPTFDDLSAAQVSAWHASHADGRALGHVHGANLGLRASAYLAVGGFARLREHEDNDLLERMRLAGMRIVPSASAEVETSGRLHGRTPGGYAGYLRQMVATDPASTR